jgi:hypothetical protein
MTCSTPPSNVAEKPDIAFDLHGAAFQCFDNFARLYTASAAEVIGRCLVTWNSPKLRESTTFFTNLFVSKRTERPNRQLQVLTLDQYVISIKRRNCEDRDLCVP